MQRCRKPTWRYQVWCELLSAVQRQRSALRFGQPQAIYLRRSRNVRARDFRRLPDLLERNFRCAIGAQQPVRLLKDINELRVAKAAKQEYVRDHFHQLAITLRKLFVAVCNTIAPRCLYPGWPALIVSNAAKLGQHDRLAAVRIAIKRENTPGWPSSVE
jgi:hypothetical protein